MNILLINQFYPPDIAPTGVKLHDLARHLVARGHTITVLSSNGSYNGNAFFESGLLDGVKVKRLKATNFGRNMYLDKLIDYLSFYLNLFIKLLVLNPRPDVVVVLTTPPYLGLIPVIVFGMRKKKEQKRQTSLNDVIRQRTKVVHWIMDLYPDVMDAHGLLKQKNIVYKILCFMNRIMFSRSDTILALGPSMIDRIEKYIEQGAEKAPLAKWVPLWGDPDLKRLSESEALVIRSKYGWKEDEFVLMHAGNIGLGVCLSEFLTVADKLGQEGPVWAFFGGGKRRDELQQFLQSHKNARIELHDYAPKTILGAADVHLVSLLSSWTGVGVPSKLQNIFAMGKPVIFMGSFKSEMAQWVMESGGGWVVNEGDVDNLLLVIEAAKDPQERIRRGQAAFRFAEQYFNQHKNCELIANIITG